MHTKSYSDKVRRIAALSGLLVAEACGGETAVPEGSSSTGVPTTGVLTGGAVPTTGEEGEPSSTGATTDEPAPGEREPARVTLQVVDGDGEPLEGALVEFDGLPQPSGVAGLVDLAVGIEALDTRLVMRVSASGHTTSTAVFEEVASGAELLKVVVLHGLGEPVVLPAEQGGVAERDGVRVEVPR